MKKLIQSLITMFILIILTSTANAMWYARFANTNGFYFYSNSPYKWTAFYTARKMCLYNTSAFDYCELIYWYEY